MVPLIATKAELDLVKASIYAMAEAVARARLLRGLVAAVPAVAFAFARVSAAQLGRVLINREARAACARSIDVSGLRRRRGSDQGADATVNNGLSHRWHTEAVGSSIQIR
jgi:hypothetical protein